MVTTKLKQLSDSFANTTIVLLTITCRSCDQCDRRYHITPTIRGYLGNYLDNYLRGNKNDSSSVIVVVVAISAASGVIFNY